VGRLLLESADKLLHAGAELIICPDNTVHEAIDIVHARLPAPWIHIAEEVTQEARRRRFKRIGLLGTRFLMEELVYPSKLGPAALITDCLLPTRANASTISFTMN
jgi:aspartate racemase